MSSSKLNQALSLFDQIVDLPAAQQTAALRQAAAGDAELYDAVAKMLQADRQTFTPLDAIAEPGLLTPGQEIGRYHIERLVGRGGMAEVWQVRHSLLGSRHALKVLTRSSPSLRARLLQEGRAQARLEHPNILPVRDVLPIGDRLGLLMPLVRGPSLESLLEQHRPDRDVQLQLLAGITEGLHCAHQGGFVHRDIKPGNVLLDIRSGRLVPRIADFGLVKDQALSQTRVGQIFGTPAYAAPEQLADASQADARSDIFSLGVLLVELVTGQLPFSGRNIPELMDAHRQPPQLGPLPPGLRELAAAMLQPDPGARPASCAEILAALPPAAPIALRGGLADVVGSFAVRRTQSAAPEPHAPTPSTPTQLPRFDDTFLGRAREQAELSELIQAHRLVTLMGMGGVGKTRLAVATATATRSVWPGGVWFCDLSEAEREVDLFAAIGRMLQVPLTRTPPRQLGDALQARGRALFVFDNIEQLLDAAASALGGWLEAAPQAHFLVTSRAPLRLRSEQCCPLGVLTSADACALFEARARLTDHRFAIDDHNRAEVSELVELLDRLPLAIELAASRTRLLTPARLLERMARRFDLLRSRSPDLPPRQRTLQATLEWSWNLLDGAERDALAQLSVFEGGFTLEAAEAVIETDSAWVEDLLAELLDKSLLVKKSHAGSTTRLGMLVSVHHFARQKLQAGAPAEVEARHGAYFAALPQPESLSGDARLAAERRTLRDQDNLRAAARRALACGEPGIAVPCARLVVGCILKQGPVSDGRDLLEAALALPGLNEPQRLLLRSDLSHVCRRLGAPEDAAAHARAGLLLAEQLQNKPAQARLRCSLGNIHRHQGAMAQARDEYERALVLNGDQNENLRAMLWGNLGALAAMHGQQEEAVAHTRTAIQIIQQRNEPRQELSWLINLGTLLRTTEPHEALRLYKRALQIARTYDNRYEEGCALGAMGNHHSHYDRPEEALRCFEQALVASRDVGDRKHEGFWLVNLGILYDKLGRLQAAEAALRDALQHAPQRGRRLEAFAWLQLGTNLGRQGRWDEATEPIAAGERMLVALRSPRPLAEGLDQLAQIALSQQRTAQAAALLARARAHAAPLADAALDASLAETAAKLAASAEV